MAKVQCTFRLPVEVVDLIDEQDGETRTDKLLCLLGFEKSISSCNVRRHVISDDFEQRLSVIEKKVSDLEEGSSNFSRKSKVKSANSSYEERTNAVVKRCRDAWLSLDSEQKKSITKKGFAEFSGVARGTVTKYWSLFTLEEIEP